MAELVIPKGPALDEFGLIERFFAPLARGDAGAFGLTDDAAALPWEAGQSLVVTSDAMVAGVHFLPEDPAETVGAKLLRVNLSDLAAMGAVPRCYTLSALLPDQVDEAWLAAFAAGLAADQEAFGIALVGGDTVRMPGPLTLSLTAFGSAPMGAELRRSGAQVGDHVFVSGEIGGAALGLALLQGSGRQISEAARESAISRYRMPVPRLALGEGLRGLASAAMDISDGLLGDLGKLVKASGVGAELHLGAVPLAPEVVTEGQPIDASLLDLGDDYELLFTISPAAAGDVAALGHRLDLAVTKVGQITAAGGLRVLDEKGRSVDVLVGGYRHF